MIDYFVGRYLLNTNIITKDRLHEVMAWLKIEHNSVSVSEMTALLAENQIAFIALLQNTIDEKLGELASEYGGPAARDIEKEQNFVAIRRQHELNTAFFGKLIAEGVVAREALTPTLEKMRKYYALNVPGVSKTFRDEFDSILGMFLTTENYYANQYAIVALNYILRFVGTKVVFDNATEVFSYSAERMMIQKVITKDERYFLGFAGDKTAMQEFNDDRDDGNFASADSNFRYGALLSFINCITNVFQCLIGSEREVILVDSANMYKFSTIFANEHCHVIPLVLKDTKLNLVIGYGTKPNFATISHNV